jgi:hypothetical protein
MQTGNNQQRPFIGTVTGLAMSPLGALVGKAIMDAATRALQQADKAQSPVVVPPVDRAVIAQEIAQEALHDPALQHLANSETHWYQKRSNWSAIIGALTPVLAIAGFNLSPELGEYIAAGLGIVGGLWAAYLARRAGTATKPLGA